MAERTRAFTLVELMLVLMIIGIMLLILVPAIPAVTGQIKAHQTEVLINTLDLGCNEYKRVFASFPATNVTDAANGWSTGGSGSAFGVYYALQGPTGSGWRASQHKVAADFGPFIESTGANVSMLAMDSQGDVMRPCFKDAFNSPIMYQKAEMANDIDLNAKSSRYGAGPWALVWARQLGWSPYYINHFKMALTKSMSGTKRIPYNPTSFILWSAGPNRLFGYWKWEDDGGWERDDGYTNIDDLHNF